MARRYAISDLAAEFSVTPRTIRFYEDEGLLAPERRGRARVYHPRDRIRLMLILRGKRLGFTLAEIREIIDMYDAEPGERGQLDLLRRKIADRRAALERKAEDIRVTLLELEAADARCRARLGELDKRFADEPPLPLFEPELEGHSAP